MADKIQTSRPASERHHDLKNQPGEDGDPTHTQEDGDLPKDVEKAIKSSDEESQIADELKKVVSDKS